MKPASKQEEEASKIAIYLIGKECGCILAERYKSAIEIQQVILNDKEQKLWNLALKGTFWMASIDSGLALINPKSQIRKKIFIMLAILETTVDFHTFFIPEKMSKFKTILLLGLNGIKAIFHAIIGLFIVKLA